MLNKILSSEFYKNNSIFHSKNAQPSSMFNNVYSIMIIDSNFDS